MIILKNKPSENFIDVEKEKEQDIQYTEDDVKFYNEYLDNYVLYVKNVSNQIFSMIIMVFFVQLLVLPLCLKSPVFGAFWLGFLSLGFYDAIHHLIEVRKKTKQLKQLKNVGFNFQYFLQQKVIRKLLNRSELVDRKILNKVIKIYPHKEELSVFFNKNNIKIINIIYAQYLNMLKHNKID